MHLQRTQDVPPAERQQSAATALLQCARQRRDGDAHANQLVLVGSPVLYDGDQVQIGQRKIHVDILVNLLVGEMGEAIEVLERIVDEAEYPLAHATFEDFFLRQRAYVQVVALHNHLRDLHHLLWHLFGYVDLELHVVVVFLPAAQLFHVLWVVGIVIDGSHGAEFVEAEGKHALGVEVGEAQRAYHLGHAFFASELLDCFEQGAAHFQVVDEVNPSESHALALPTLVGTVVDDGCHASHEFPFLVGEVVFCLTEFESGIFILAQRVHVVAEKRRCIVGIACV